MRITKEEFCTFIETYNEYRHFLHQLENLTNMSFLETKFDGILDDWYDMVQSLFDFDEDAYNTEYGTELDYFVFELDCGRHWKSGMVIINDKDIDLSTPEKFYDYMTIYDKNGVQI